MLFISILTSFSLDLPNRPSRSQPNQKMMARSLRTLCIVRVVPSLYYSSISLSDTLWFCGSGCQRSAEGAARQQEKAARASRHRSRGQRWEEKMFKQFDGMSDWWLAHSQSGRLLRDQVTKISPVVKLGSETSTWSISVINFCNQFLKGFPLVARFFSALCFWAQLSM